MKKTIAFLLCCLLALGVFTPSRAAGSAPEETTNYASQNYSMRASTVKSYLYENASGGLTRVEYTENGVVVENYDSGFRYLSGQIIPMELPIWGGFFAGQDYNFLVEGQNNEAESDSTEVIRVIKYDKSWNRIGSAGLYGANTLEPFSFGSLRMAEYGGELYIRTCHKMYTSDDGLNHQASVTMAVRQSDMTVTDSWYEVMNISYGYVSHSFNQFVMVDPDRNIVCVDQGDAFPRSAVLMRYPVKAGNGVFTADWGNNVEYVEVQPYAGQVGNNTTGATIGGLAGTSQGYLVAHTYDGAGGGGTQLPYLSFVDKSSLAVTTRALPYQDAACPPMLVPTGANTGYVLWNQQNTSVNTGYIYYRYDADGNRIPYTPDPVHGDDTLYYVTYAADGSFGSVKTAANAPLSDCQPILYGGNVVWYVTEKSVPKFYILSSSGVTTGDAQAPRITTQPKSVTAAAGGTAKFTVVATGTGLTYQWQYQLPGSSTWADSPATGNKTATLSVPATTDRNGNKYRCIVKSGSVSTTSSAATLTVMVTSAPVITTQPKSVTAAEGSTAKFTVAATGTSLTYQWQYQLPGSSAWADSPATGNKTATLSVPATTDRNGNKYRCIVTNSAGSVYTVAVTLIVN